MILMKKELKQNPRGSAWYRDKAGHAFLCHAELEGYLIVPEHINVIIVVIYDRCGPCRVKVEQRFNGFYVDDIFVILLESAENLLRPLLKTRKYVYVEIEYDEPE